MKRNILAAAALVAALSVSGCTGGTLATQDATNAPTASQTASATTPPATTTPTPTPEPSYMIDAMTSQEFAAGAKLHFLDSYGARSLKGFDKESIERHAEKWDSPARGVVEITVTGNGYATSELGALADDFMHRVGCASDLTSKAVVKTEDGKKSSTSTRCS